VTREKPSISYSRIVCFALYGLRSKRFLRHSRYSRHLRHSQTTNINVARILGILLLAIPLTATADPFGPGGIGKESGEQLLVRCEPALRMIEAGADAGLSAAERIEAASCIGFVDGFIWGHAWSAWRERSDMFYCPPELFSAREGVPALMSYLRTHPDRMIQRAHLLLFAAFNSAYPCKP
jgi:hypothetical protein